MVLNKLKSGLYCENDCAKRCGPPIAMPVLALASSHAQDQHFAFSNTTNFIYLSHTRLTNREFEAQIMKSTLEMSH